jgi:DNA-binding NarL/FixJ family response regulator
MDPPRVYFICVNRLVCEAVNVLLLREGIVLLGMETDPEVALEQARSLKPDIVLIEGNGNGSDASLMTRLAQLVYENENLRVIRLSLTDGQVHIYHQEQRQLITTQDLIAAIYSHTTQATT